MMKDETKKIFLGHVGHERLTPKKNKFLYRIFLFHLPLSNIEKQGTALFSINKWNIFSIWNKDFGGRDNTRPYEWAKNILERFSSVKSFPA